MTENREERAMRIMEALSGVDEELLERSGQTAGKKTSRGHEQMLGKKTRHGQEQILGKKTGHVHEQISDEKLSRGGAFDSGIRTFLWRHAKAWAAVLCLAIVGGMAWGGYQLKMADARRNGFNSSGMAANGGQAMDDSLPESEGNAADIPLTAGNIPESPEDADGNGAQGQVNLGDNGNTSTSGSENGMVSGAQQPVGAQQSGISEAEAWGMDGLGNYIPLMVPEGYVFECAYSSAGTQESGETAVWLNIIWTNGIDQIELYIEKTEDGCDVVNVDKRELYDVRLYGQPYEETVPDEYKAVFYAPIFALGDFGPEIVESRMVPLDEENQDTGVSKGNFSVLYPDNVLIRFNGAGTAEEIWEMFRSINE